MKHIISLVIFLFIFISNVNAEELTGFAAIDTRLFLHAPAYDQQRNNSGSTLVLEPEYYHVWNKEADTITIRPFARLDPYDSNRRHVDIRQLDWVHAQGKWEIRAGVSEIFWGVIESKHLVNIINQTDAVEDLDDEDKLGQPMVQFSYFTDYGTFQLFYLPYFRERSFPGRHGRLRASIPVDTSGAGYASSAKQWHQDIALRYTHTYEDWDIGLAHFSGTSREPNLLLSTNPTADSVAIPFYHIIDQTSLDLQLTTESWLWKLEAFSRAGHGDRFEAFSFGFEYSFYGVMESDVDVGVLMEYHYDNRTSAAPAEILDRDIFLGSRIVLNNSSDTEILSGMMVDITSKTRSFLAEISHRINNHWKFTLDGRFFAHTNHTILNPIGNDDHIQFRFSYHF